MTISEYTQYWGSQNLQRYDAGIINSLTISAESKLFLIEAGLPRVTMRYLYFDVPPNDLPLLSSLWDGRFLPPQSCASYRVIGIHAFSMQKYLDQKSEILICIDEEQGGRIVNVIAENKWIGQKNWKVNFMNSSVSQFAEFLLIFRQNSEWKQANWNNRTEKEILKHGKKVIERLRDVDSVGCDPDTEWGGEGGLIFEIENGL